MDIQTRKISFVQDFLKIQDEKIISLFEKILRKEQNQLFLDKIEPMTLDEFNERIDKSLADSKAGKLTESKALIHEIESWK